MICLKLTKEELITKLLTKQMILYQKYDSEACACIELINIELQDTFNNNYLMDFISKIKAINK